MLAFSLQKVSRWVWRYRGNGNNSWYFTAVCYVNFRQQLWKCIRSCTDLSILPQFNSILQQEFAGLGGGVLIFTLFDSLQRLIHTAVGFPECIKGCYILLPEQALICFCARCNLPIELVIHTCLPTRSSKQLVYHSAQPVCPSTCHLV